MVITSLARVRLLALALVTSLAAGLPAGCSSPPPATCTLGTTTGCADGTVCEARGDGMPGGVCFAPIFVEGRVFDSTDDAPIDGARLLAVDANGTGLSEAVFSAADGTYSLRVPTPRDASGAPMSEPVLLRVSASGYQPFPKAPRTALPIDLDLATSVAGRLVVRSAATDVALIPLAGGATGATVSGRIDSLEAGGALVLALSGTSVVGGALADALGEFVIFDVPVGALHVEGYVAGLRIVPEDVTVAAAGLADVVLDVATDGLGTVTGTVQIVNAPGGSETSVILVVESTFSETAARGEAPAGMRAFPVSGSFTIEGVPPGRYVALAAFENDGLVRDPDTSIGGTMIVHFEVPASGGVVDLADGFKVTAALAVVSPGARGLELVPDADPTFAWQDDSSEDGYELRVFDAFGVMVHENTMIPSASGAGDVTYTWTGAALTSGMVYQFRVLSFRDDARGRTYISATEDLLGAFEVE